ncbi:uncharacterized protein LOC9661847 [Selaginella moellendorffii]|nr:uncharacterized protein LOC9661847 [Selaginella moellendorffii]|eukprot:XP_002988838.2 uncharacterized protein LOC9661847 [Selaginella moellendorffii]
MPPRFFCAFGEMPSILFRKKLAMACCKMYVSTSSNRQAMENIEQAMRGHPQVPLLHTFRDEHYDRVGYTLAGKCGSTASRENFADAIVDMIRAAILNIDLQKQSGSHPRLGVVDNLCFHPLGKEASMDQAAELARSCARSIGAKLQVPTFLYGAASYENVPLDAIRRSLGYFKPAKPGIWQGSSNNTRLSQPPQFGPAHFPASTGIITAGACPWIANYNIPLQTGDLQAARRIARSVSQRGGGLAHVQAMALAHGVDSIEIACNLLDVHETSPSSVQSFVELLARDEPSVERVCLGYLTNLQEESILELAMEKMEP